MGIYKTLDTANEAAFKLAAAEFRSNSNSPASSTTSNVGSATKSTTPVNAITNFKSSVSAYASSVSSSDEDDGAIKRQMSKDGRCICKCNDDVQFQVRALRYRHVGVSIGWWYADDEVAAEQGRLLNHGL
jgi:hypothetical protein